MFDGMFVRKLINFALINNLNYLSLKLILQISFLLFIPPIFYEHSKYNFYNNDIISFKTDRHEWRATEEPTNFLISHSL